MSSTRSSCINLVDRIYYISQDLLSTVRSVTLLGLISHTKSHQSFPSYINSNDGSSECHHLGICILHSLCILQWCSFLTLPWTRPSYYFSPGIYHPQVTPGMAFPIHPRPQILYSNSNCTSGWTRMALDSALRRAKSWTDHHN